MASVPAAANVCLPALLLWLRPKRRVRWRGQNKTRGEFLRGAPAPKWHYYPERRANGIPESPAGRISAVGKAGETRGRGACPGPDARKAGPKESGG